MLGIPVYARRSRSSATPSLEEWKKYLETDGITTANYGDDQELMTTMDNLFVIEKEYPSQGYVTELTDGPYAGRLEDDDGVMFFPLIGAGVDHIPLSTFDNYFDDLISFMIEEVATEVNMGMYLMGGAVSSSSDQMDSLGPLRREAAIARLSLQPNSMGGNADLYEKFYELVYRDVDTTTPDFPGMMCHNHASNEAIGPLKLDWTKPCPSLLEASPAEREELCISQDESFWGTVNVELLKGIKNAVDPSNMFVCNGGIGAGSPYSSDEVFPPAGDDPLGGGCGEAAACFDDVGCSTFDKSTQTWSGLSAPCNDALDCASFFPDSSCFSKSDEGNEDNPVVSPVASPVALPPSVEIEDDASGSPAVFAFLRGSTVLALLLPVLLSFI